MLLSDLILAVIGKHGPGGCRGRTRLQKEVYFLRKPLDVEVVFQPHYYGPYSRELATAVQSLVAEGLVHEEREPGPAEGPFEGVVYTYTLEPDGQEVAEAWRTGEPGEAKRLDDAFSRLDLADQSLPRLAVASKIHHVVSASGGPVPRSELSRRARELGWEVTPEDEDTAVGFLLDHELVTED
jgi:uncharacterized protein YwgA